MGYTSRRSKKMMVGLASIALLLQAGQSSAMVVSAQPKHTDPKVYLFQDSATVISQEKSQWNFQAMKAQLAFDNGYTGKNVKIAVIDTGVAPHKDLKIAGGVSTVDGVSSYVDTNGHGTHVAGIINAQPNSFGTVGIAPDAKLYAVKAVSGNNGGKLSDIVEGIEWAIANKMDIISLSIGIKTDEKALRDVVQKAYDQGILIVASSGNDGSNSPVLYPAKYPEVIAVSAVDKSMNQASFSSQGGEVDFTAPGVDVVSTYLNGQYALISGTSQATPHIVGMLALLKEKYPNKTNVELEQELRSLSTDLGSKGKDNIFGYGFVSYQNTPESSTTVSTPVVEETFTALQKSYISYAERYIGYITEQKKTAYATTAQSYINKLPDGKKKAELNQRLQNAIALVTGKTTSSDTTATSTQSATETLTEIQKTYISYAERYIGYVKVQKKTSYSTTAQRYISKLPDGATKAQLQKKLDEAVALVTGKSTTSSTTSEPSSAVTQSTTESFTAIQKTYISYAERYIGYVKDQKKTFYASTAQFYINKLPDGATKSDLQKKLNDAVASVK
jgi:minor extracellular protease Epr